MAVRIILCVLFFLLSPEVVPQAFEWGKLVSGSVELTSIGRDDAGNFIVAGSFYDIINFDGIICTSAGEKDALIIKYNSEGSVLWYRKFGSISDEAIAGLAIDNEGNYVFAGSFSDSITFNSSTLYSRGLKDIFILKLNPNGNIVWVKQAGGNGEDIASKIACDKSGNIYLTGSYFGNSQFEDSVITNIGPFGIFDIYLAKYESSGSLKWVKSFGGASDDFGYGVTANDAGICFITGEFSGNANFGDRLLTSNGSNDIFAVKVSVLGNVLWALNAGSEEWDLGKDIHHDPYGNVLVSGVFRGNAEFGSYNLISRGNNDIFISKISGSGEFINCKGFGGPGEDVVNAVFSSDGKDINITGYFQNTAYFGNDTIHTTNSGDVFICKLDSACESRWVVAGGGGDFDSGNDLVTDNWGDCYIVGTADAPPVFGNIRLQNSGGFFIKTKTVYLTGVTPEGGETWQSGTKHNITWKGNLDGKLKIEFSSNGGNSWLVIKDTISAFYRSYTFNAPAINSVNCEIRISSIDFSAIQYKSLPFEITTASCPGIELISPSTFVSWNAGLTKTIIWQTRGNIENVSIWITTDGCESWEKVIDSISAAGGIFNWQIPDYLSSRCKIRIICLENSKIYDQSDEYFSINNLKLLSPLGGEKWKVGTVRQIKWSVLGIPRINILFSSDNGYTWSPIRTNQLSASGNYNWTIPDKVSTDCLIRLVNSSDSLVRSSSTSKFTIWKPISFSITPNAGNFGGVFGETKLSFFAEINNIVPIEIKYYPYEEPLSSVLPQGVVRSSGYYWDFHAPGLIFNNGRISILLSDLGGVTDSSKLVWMKRDSVSGAWINLGGTVIQGKLMSQVFFDKSLQFVVGSTNNSNTLPVKESSNGEKSFNLSQNYPNPFNPETTIKYQLESDNIVKMELFNSLGEKVLTILDRFDTAGEHSIKLSLREHGLVSGIYFCRLNSGAYSKVIKMVLMK